MTEFPNCSPLDKSSWFSYRAGRGCFVRSVAGSFMIFLLFLASCAPRLHLQQAFKDDAGHDLYLFDGGWYLATTGDRADQF